MELAKLLLPDFPGARATRPFGEMAREFGTDLGMRVKRRLTQWGIVRPLGRAAFFKARRKFKGLEG